MSLIIPSRFPPESATSAYFDREANVWLDDDGEVYLDLCEFGFTALQRETILIEILTNPEAEYIYTLNDRNEEVEIFWEYVKGE